MVLDRLRPYADTLLDPVARRMLGVSPNTVSWASLIAAILAGFAFYEGGAGFLIAALVLILGSAYLDALDGKIARLSNRASPKGDFVDHVFDRYADVFLFGGASFSAYCVGQLWVGLLAIVGVLLTSYMGTQAQAVGQGRRYAGMLGRADRLILLVLGGLVQLLVSPAGNVLWGYGSILFQPLGWFLVLFAILGNVTAIQRAVAVWRGFDAPP